MKYLLLINEVLSPLGGGNKKVIVRPPEFGLNPAQILVATITFLNYPRAPL